MTGEGGTAGPAPNGPAELLTLAASRPREAMTRARALLAASPSRADASVCRQVIGIVLRDFGDIAESIGQLRAALRLARGTADREADVLATLGATLVYAGRTRQGLDALGEAVRLAGPGLAGRVLVRRGVALQLLGRPREAMDDLRPAIELLDGDPIWAARALTTRAFAQLALGATERAEADIGAAARLLAEAGQELESAFAQHNRGLVASRSGNPPLALSFFDEAARQYARLEATVPDLSLDRCSVLLAAGLPRDALDEAVAAIKVIDEIRGQATKKAELLLAAATAALAAGDPEAATEQARTAYRMFGAQQRPWWRAGARLLLLQARFESGEVTGGLLRQAELTAKALAELGSEQALRAHLLAGRIALARGKRAVAERHFAAVTPARRSGPALSRVEGWLAEALRAEAAGDVRRMLSACRTGLDLVDGYRLTLGASELRAHATAHGAELAAMAQRHVLRAQPPRGLLVWSERWRAAALAVPRVAPPEDPALQSELTALREVSSLATPGSRREQRRLENAIRARVLRTQGGGEFDGHRLDVPTLLGALGPARLVEIVDVDGELHVLVCGGGEVRRFTAGSVAEAGREADFARLGLTTLGANRTTRRVDPALGMVEFTGERLERLLLGAAAGHLGDGPVIVVPPAALHAIPWAVLPALRHRELSVAPSASVWLRARNAVAPRRRDVVLVRGPGLETGGAEVPALAKEYDDVVELGQGAATAGRVLAALDGAWLAHIAAHGTFRADSPMFSSLRMDDGPLTVHDFERLRRAPHRLVLSSCDSGRLATTGADELLGLTSSLVPLGTAGIIASVVPVNDAAVVPLMVETHRHLRRGASLAGALSAARHALRDDQLVTVTGLSFIALGAG
ncbi:CHAT domain-containing protein [Amycolatopsis sp. cg5]|uniref:CHAT domain-containing protein n=1 Tax=Amycolatopsis sp. cg5 TaxID=3238802 RepID=UPI003524EE38